MLTHTAERLHKCDKCDAAFLKVSQLTNHMFTHSEVKRFACDQCDRRFSHKGMCGNMHWNVPQGGGAGSHRSLVRQVAP